MIANGSKVSMHYTLHVEGELVDSSEGKDPLEFVQGEGAIIPGLERELLGLAVGDEKQVEVKPEDGYGQRKEEGVQQVPRSAFGDTDGLRPGIIVQGEIQGSPFQATVVEIAEEHVTLDLNHPLAGKTLSFKIEIVAVG